MRKVRTTLDYGLALLPGAATGALAFQAGGFFADSWTPVACVLGVLLVLRITLSERPFAGLSRPLLAALFALTLFSAWVLASSWWSDSPGRATIEYSRVLTYLLALVLLGSTPWTRRRTTVAITGVVAALAVIVGAALIARLRPDLLTGPGGVDPRRMAWPITYWNGLGFVAAAASVLALHLASWEGSARTLRPLAAALLPGLAAGLYLTLSRGAIVSLAVGLVAYVVIGRPRALICTVVAAGAPTVLAVLTVYDAPSLLGYDPTLPGTISDGRRVANDLLLAMLVAGGLRALLLPVDAWLARLRLPAWSWPVRAGVAAGVLALVTVGLFASGAVSWGRAQADTLLHGSAVQEDDIRTRLLTFDNNGRFAHWRVSLDAFEAHPLLGDGAGTYEVDWKRERSVNFQVVDGHSLYFETLGELGLVGLALLLTALGALVVGLAWRARGPDRPLLAAVLAAVLTWAAHAALDWIWELTSATIWVFGLAAVALAAPAGAGPVDRAVGRLVRVVLGLGALLLLLVPVNVYRSQTAYTTAVEAYKARDCARSTDAALDALDALPVRADALEIIAYCDLRSGRPELAVSAARRAVELDPRSWDRRYALAISLAIAGRDPRAEAAEALRLNPMDPLAQGAVAAFETGKQKTWTRRALRLPLPGR